MNIWYDLLRLCKNRAKNSSLKPQQEPFLSTSKASLILRVVSNDMYSVPFFEGFQKLD